MQKQFFGCLIETGGLTGVPAASGNLKGVAEAP